MLGFDVKLFNHSMQTPRYNLLYLIFMLVVNFHRGMYVCVYSTVYACCADYVVLFVLGWLCCACAVVVV